MKKIELIALSAIAIATTSFVYKNTALNKDKGYSITGYVQDYPDDTKLYLDYELEETKITDSTTVLNGHFKFAGVININAVYTLIHTKTYSDYKYFWLENNVITFKAVKGNFRQAIITGSKTQIDEDKLSAMTGEVKRDSLRNLLNKNIEDAKKKEITTELAKLKDEEFTIDEEFIKNNPSSIVSAETLDVYASNFGKEKSTLLYNNFSEENKNTGYGKNILRFISLNKTLNVGDHYVDFSQKDPLGKEIKVSDYKDKVILIEFWASNCGPCRKGNPELVKTYNNFKDKGFEIVGISLDEERDNWITAIKKDGLPWPNISELKGNQNTAALIYGINGIPDNFLIDKNGLILARDLRDQALYDKLKEVLK